MNKYFIYILFLFFQYCKNGGNDLKLELTSNHCFWDLSDSLSNSLGRKAFCYKFEKNGNCKYYFYDKFGKRIENDDNDMIVPKTWTIESDVFFIRGLKRNIISHSDSVIILLNPLNNKSDTLIKNCRN
jgi:hypothetical protein